MTTAEAASPMEASVPSNRWWILLLEGIAGIIIGILLFTDTEQTVFTLVLFLGIWWFIGGIIDLITLFFNREQWGWRLFTGILGIIAGLILIRHPVWSAFLVPATLAWVLAIFGIVIGIMGLIRAFQGEGWGAGILGVISIVFGLWLLGADLGMQIALIVYGAAIWAIIGGIVAIIWAFRVRSA
ncbi:MAG: DUF308 domain-containing protein [Chloroflexi bacterium]|nr:DUF308 domain-containing protein [Chloroflexota bacterium]